MGRGGEARNPWTNWVLQTILTRVQAILVGIQAQRHGLPIFCIVAIPEDAGPSLDKIE
jgi:hypothetical protein